jgi:Flp pilus assembly protein CpaB
VSSRRTLILLAALAVGVVAALLLFEYVKGIEDRAFDNAKRVNVYYATADIKRGTAGEDAVNADDIKQTEIPQQFKPATAIQSTDEIAKKVALFDIAQNSVIIKDMFVDPSTTQISFRQRLKNPDHVAISFTADQVHAVGGFLVAGDEVNMMVLQDNGGGAAGSSDNSSSNGGNGSNNNNNKSGTTDQTPSVIKQKARMLYQKVQLLAVGENAKLQPGESTPSTDANGNATTSQSQTSNSSIFTTNVPAEASLWVASANAGTIYLSLVADEYKPSVVQPIPDVITTLPGEDPNQLTPYGPNGNTDK